MKFKTTLLTAGIMGLTLLTGCPDVSVPAITNPNSMPFQNFTDAVKSSLDISDIEQHEDIDIIKFSKSVLDAKEARNKFQSQLPALKHLDQAVEWLDKGNQLQSCTQNMTDPLPESECGLSDLEKLFNNRSTDPKTLKLDSGFMKGHVSRLLWIEANKEFMAAQTYIKAPSDADKK